MMDVAEHRAKLVRMANQISASVPDPLRAGEQTANHLRGFWTPGMLDELIGAAAQDPDALYPAVHEALAALRPTATVLD